MFARFALGLGFVAMSAAGWLVASDGYGPAGPALAPDSRASQQSSSAIRRLRTAHDELSKWLASSRHGPGWHEFLGSDELREQMRLGRGAKKEILQDLLSRSAADHPGLRLSRFTAVRAALAGWLKELSAPTLEELPGKLRTASTAFVSLDNQLLKAPRRGTRQAIEALDKFLGTSRRGTGWRTYLRFEELLAQVGDDAQPDLGLLDDVLRRFSAKHNGLELPPFAGVRQALATYVGLLRDADDPETEIAYHDHLERLAALIETAGDEPSPLERAQIEASLAWLEDRGQIPELAPLVRQHFFKEASPPRSPPPVAAAKSTSLARLMSESKDGRLRRVLPKVEDPDLEKLFKDPSLILYTEAEMPKAYQIWDGELQGVHRASYNISAEASEPYGNGNYEFPWGKPAGTHRARGVTSFRFLSLPRGRDGQLWPVVWYRKHIRGDTQASYAWTFPVGTTVGEVLSMRGPDGYDYTFEVRLRFRKSDHWGVDVFRPFPTAADLAARVKELRPDAAKQPKLARLLRHLEGSVNLPRQRMGDSHPTRRVISQWSGRDVLPAVDDDRLIKELLTTTPFRSCLGQAWRTGKNGAWAFAATTRSKFHVVPANYAAGFVEVSRTSCLRCHQTVNQPVSRFDFTRDWYGHIRGSDGIFSYHPFEPSTLSGNGFSSGVSMRREFTQSGVLQRYDRGRHPRHVYTRIRHLEG